MAMKEQLRDLNSMLAIQFGTGVQFRRVRSRKAVMLVGPVLNNLSPEFADCGVTLARDWFSHPHSDLFRLVCRMLEAVLVRTVACRRCDAVRDMESLMTITAAGWISPIFTPAGRLATWMATCPQCVGVTAP